ncbi:MAG: DNA repair protein RecO [Treponema sp.]|nr:DNA repair protein RecO [Treponema sp.]
MSRTAVYTALILRSRSSGESNSEATLLTAEEGIIKATVFGGAKSKLRAHSAPYNSGQVWIYRDKSKDYGKISDFDVCNWRPGLRDKYDRTMAAAAVAETILSSHGGGGEWGVALKIATNTLDALEDANEEFCGRVLVHFLWKWACFLGIQPHIENCSACGKNSDNIFWFNVHEGTALCAICDSNNDEQFSVNRERSGLLKLNPGCRRWLALTNDMESSDTHRYSMDNKTFNEVKSLVTAVLSAAYGKRLASWEW